MFECAEYNLVLFTQCADVKLKKVSCIWMQKHPPKLEAVLSNAAVVVTLNYIS